MIFVNNSNQNFTEEKYKKFLNDLNSKHPNDIVFRNCRNSPFLSLKILTKKVLDACEAIVDVIVDKNFILLF